jgi:4-hydroxybutyrate dehydrogenase
MKNIVFKPELYSFDTFEEFAEDFKIGEDDLIITNEYILAAYKNRENLNCDIIYQEHYGAGEPSDAMVDAMSEAIAKMRPHKRIIGIGGGTVLDISKIFALRSHYPAADLYDRKLPIEKDKELILIPTTCGTGSEVTNIAILAFLSRNTKIGLAVNEMYADKAVLIPEFLKNLPFRFFATSSIDAFIHAVESSLSPKATPYTELFGYKAIEMILNGYKKIAEEGEDARQDLLKDFLIASNYAGLAFGTAGCGPVHALSYPLGGTFHVAHGEANYAILDGVMNCYVHGPENAQFAKLKGFIAGLLGCEADDVFVELKKLLDQIIRKKSLREYGADEKMLEDWSQNVIMNQQRLMVNSPFPLDYDDVLKIYLSLLD